jgi:hypothetical protein
MTPGESIIYAVVQAIRGLVLQLLAWFPSPRAATVAIEDVPSHILDNTTDIRAVTEALTTWEENTTAQVAQLQVNAVNPHLANLTDILDAVLDLTPPAGPTIQDVLDAIAALNNAPAAPTASQVADGVWGADDPLPGTEMKNRGQELTRIWQVADELEEGASLPSRQAQHFVVDIPDAPSQESYILMFYPNPDWTDILPAEDRITWLNRTDVYFTYEYVPDSQTIFGYSLDPLAPYTRWTFQLTEQEFQALKGVTVSGLEPVWPGIAGVTLGTPVALADTFSSAEECHGVLVAIATWPTAYGSYDWGTDVQHPRAGYLSFTSDNGEQTVVSSFTFTNELVMVKGMVSAVGFLGRAKPGVEGTVTPFLIGTP